MYFTIYFGIVNIQSGKTFFFVQYYKFYVMYFVIIAYRFFISFSNL